MQYRQEIVGVFDQDLRKLSGEIECDESYFGGTKKEPRGRGSREKMIVFGMLERQNKIFIMFLLKTSWMRLKTMLKKAVFFIRILPDRTNRCRNVDITLRWSTAENLAPKDVILTA